MSQELEDFLGAEWARAVGYNEQRNAALNEQRATKHTGTQRVTSDEFLFRILFRDRCGGVLFTFQTPADRDAASEQSRVVPASC